MSTFQRIFVFWLNSWPLLDGPFNIDSWRLTSLTITPNCLMLLNQLNKTGLTFSWISDVLCASQNATVATSFSIGISIEQSRPSSRATSGRDCIGPFEIGPRTSPKRDRFGNISLVSCRETYFGGVFRVPFPAQHNYYPTYHSVDCASGFGVTVLGFFFGTALSCMYYFSSLMIQNKISDSVADIGLISLGFNTCVYRTTTSILLRLRTDFSFPVK